MYYSFAFMNISQQLLLGWHYLESLVLSLQRDQMIRVGNAIKEECQKQIDEVTAKVKDQLRPLNDHLTTVWGMSQNLAMLQKRCAQLDQLLIQIAQERSLVLKSLSAVSCLKASLRLT